MKNALLFSICLIAFSKVQSQITINASNLFDAGDRYINGLAYLNLDPNVVPGNNGPSQVWNFSTTVFDAIDTTDIYAPGWVAPAYTAACPQATHLMEYGAGGTNFDLILADQTGFYIVGSSSYSPIYGVQTSVYQNYVDWMRFPATYGQSYIDTSYADNTMAVNNGSIDSVRSIITITFTSNINAWGTLTLSAGTFSSIRVTRNLSYDIVSFDHDSITGWQSPSTYSLSQTMYEWWTDAAGFGYPIATIYTDQVGTVTQYNILQIATTEISEQNTSNVLFSLYPSPAVTSVTVETENANGMWQMYDLTGRMVMSGNITSTLTQIEVGALQSGIYTMIVEDEEGNSAAKKFVKE